MKENILDTLCLSCMKDAGEKFETCPFCGAAASFENQFHQLAPGSVLNGRYVVGKTLGQGGFGITYAGYDLTADDKVAIKEFYPDGGVSRQKDLYTILPYSQQETEELFTDGRTKFLKEAQKLAKFANTEGIVQVRDYFEENGTAYIVMEYIEGPTLMQYLNKLGQPILPSDLYMLLTPVFNALEQVHAQGILHRDISPDNIIISPSAAKLLDFGAARDFSLQGEKSNTVNIKAGYAPEEQYRTHGKQGPWTDVYALSAVCYRAVTGKNPPSSIDRLSSDDLVPPSTLSANVTPAIEKVLLKGMAVKKENRYQSVKEFHNALDRAVNGTPESASVLKTLRPACIFAAVAAVIAVLLFLFIPRSNATMTVNGKNIPVKMSLLAFTRLESGKDGYEVQFAGKTDDQMFTVSAGFISGYPQTNTVYRSKDKSGVAHFVRLNYSGKGLPSYWNRYVSAGMTSYTGEIVDWEIVVGDFAPDGFINITISGTAHYKNLVFDFKVSGKANFDENAGEETFLEWIENNRIPLPKG